MVAEVSTNLKHSFLALSLVLVCCCSGARAQSRMTIEEERDVPEFTGVAVYAPFTVLVSPQADAYRVVLRAEQSILNILDTSVDANGTLSITAEGNFSTNYEVQITVFMPADSLTSLASYGPLADLIVQAPSLTVDNLRIETGLSSRRVYLGNCTILGELEIYDNSGRSFIVVEGEINRAVIVSGRGLGSRSIIHLEHVLESVQVDLTGTMNLYVGQGPDSVISGQNTGINSKIYYSNGTCEVARCTEKPDYSISSSVPMLDWTCGLRGKGSFTPANDDDAIVALEVMSVGGFNRNGMNERAASSLGARSQDGMSFSHGAASRSGSSATATATSMSSSTSAASSSVSVSVTRGREQITETTTSVGIDGLNERSTARDMGSANIVPPSLMQAVILRNTTSNDTVASITTIPCLSDQ
ncbi:hypothetical protein M9435_003092 [Picochlorum sp. BPE23]|nr:hypothetical protein M9435_003092 [Picochlorum sp. BPE23]